MIEFLGANDWLRGVEIRRGQVEEESGIEVLQDLEEKATPALKGLSGGADGDSVKGGAAIVELATTAPATDIQIADASSVSAQSSKPTSATETLPPPPPPSLPPVASKPPVAGLFADYGSDSEDDEADEQAVASALMASA